MVKFKMTCDSCNMIHELERTPEIPSNVISMGCNWCPNCEDTADGYYEEWYNENDGDGNTDNPDDLPDNQLVMPFIIEECFNKPEKLVTV